MKQHTNTNLQLTAVRFYEDPDNDTLNRDLAGILELTSRDAALRIELDFWVKPDPGECEVRGINRNIEITITDETDGTVWSNHEIRLHIGCTKGEATRTVSYVNAAERLKDGHVYKLWVRESRSGILLGTDGIEIVNRLPDAPNPDHVTEVEIDDDEFDALLRKFIRNESESPRTGIYEETLGEEAGDEVDEFDLDFPLSEPETAPEPEPEPAFAMLDNLTGLVQVKEKLHRLEKVVLFNKLRRENGLPVSTSPLHCMFLGSPGTGKTTVAGALGRMLAEAGVLSKGHVVFRERSTLLGPNYSNEETNTLNAIEEAQGGILFIDEAYQLYQPKDPRDPGRFVIETLMTALADESRRDWMLILAGYPAELEAMRDMNPGLRSRIPDSNLYTFDDFSESELMEIAVRWLDRHGFRLSTEAETALRQRLAADYARRDKSFGNARHVNNILETEVLPAMATRVIDENTGNPDDLVVIRAVDIPRHAPASRTKEKPRLGFR